MSHRHRLNNDEIPLPMVIDPASGHLFQCFFPPSLKLFSNLYLPIPEQKREGHAVGELGSSTKSSINGIKLTFRTWKDFELLLNPTLLEGVISAIWKKGMLHLFFHPCYFPSMERYSQRQLPKFLEIPVVLVDPQAEIGSCMIGDEVGS